MTCSVRIVNDGNCIGDTVTVRHGRDHAASEVLTLGAVSGRISADQTVKLECEHGDGPSVGNVIVETHVPRGREVAGIVAYERYCDAVGGTTFDGKPLPSWTALGDRQKAGWCSAAGLSCVENPYMADSG